MKSQLAERAVLMRLSISLPGESRKDRQLTGTVQSEHNMTQDSGKWMKDLYPKEALAPIKKLDNKARAYHAAVTLPWDNGVGILPAAFIVEYSSRMAQFRAERKNLVESHFMAKYQQWVEWARQAHNGTFTEDLYDADEARKQFDFNFEPIPVPGSEHFSDSVANLLGVDTESVDRRVGDAYVEAQRELLRRMIGPVEAMAHKLATEGKAIFRDSLIGNVQEIVELGTKLNIADDPKINGFLNEMKGLLYQPEGLRKDPEVRKVAAKNAQDLLHRLSGYQL